MGMGCSQGNVSFYEKGQTVPPDAAKRLIEFAATLGRTITFNDVYRTDPTLEVQMTEAAQAGLIERRDPTKPGRRSLDTKAHAALAAAGQGA